MVKNKDYSNTIIYKICCKDEIIKDIYVGHTTNFKKRKYQHQNYCSNNKLNYCKIYKTINENGGWNNWEMIELETVNCKNLLEARQKENEYYNLLNASLNSIPPYKEPIINLKPINDNKLLNEKTFTCKNCNFECNYKRDYDRHISTNKHKLQILQTEKEINMDSKYNCISCNKIFKDRSGLWKHNKSCKVINNNSNLDNLSLLSFIKEQAIYNKNIQDELLSQIMLLKNEIITIKEKIK